MTKQQSRTRIMTVLMALSILHVPQLLFPDTFVLTNPILSALPAQTGQAAQKINPNAKKRVILYNFKAIGEPEKHEYYSYIIPQTIGKNLTAKGKFTVARIQQEGPAETDPLVLSDQIGKAAIQHGADYVITGSVNVLPNELVVTMKIRDMKKGTLKEVRSSSQEVGALLQDVIDDCSAAVEQNLDVLNLQHSVTQVQPTHEEEAPPRGFYDSLSGLSFGIEGGMFFIQNQWDAGFDDGYFVRSYVQYLFIPMIGISVGCDYLSTDNGENNDYFDSQLSQWAPTIAVVISLPLSRYFSITTAMGAGYAYTEINHRLTGASSPFDAIARTTRSWDPCISVMLAVNFIFKPVVLTVGTSYKNTFIFGEQFELFTFHGGIGYAF